VNQKACVTCDFICHIETEGCLKITVYHILYTKNVNVLEMVQNTGRNFVTTDK